LSTKRVLLTGASRGIGRSIAHALAEDGWRVTMIARDETRLEQSRRALPGDGHEALAFDVSDEDAWARIASDVQNVNAVVCAAAVLDPIGPIDSYLPSDFRRTLEINLLGTLLAIRTCLPGLRAARGAAVTFSGGGATAPLPRFDAYATSKAAVVRLTENIALDLASDGVRVNCVAPGFVATSMHERTLAAGPALAGADYFERTRSELERGGAPIGEIAELVRLMLEENPRAPFTGKLISAQWDPWREVAFRERLARERNLATLRRIDDIFFTTASAEERT
jgi:3-oxoacyl-[acyl-carrier protein] reductase